MVELTEIPKNQGINGWCNDAVNSGSSSPITYPPVLNFSDEDPDSSSTPQGCGRDDHHNNITIGNNNGSVVYDDIVNIHNGNVDGEGTGNENGGNDNNNGLISEVYDDRDWIRIQYIKVYNDGYHIAATFYTYVNVNSLDSWSGLSREVHTVLKTQPLEGIVQVMGFAASGEEYFIYRLFDYSWDDVKMHITDVYLLQVMYYVPYMLHDMPCEYNHHTQTVRGDDEHLINNIFDLMDWFEPIEPIHVFDNLQIGDDDGAFRGGNGGNNGGNGGSFRVDFRQLVSCCSAVIWYSVGIAVLIQTVQDMVEFVDMI